MDGVLSYRDEHFWEHSSKVLCGIIHVQVTPSSKEQRVISQVVIGGVEGGLWGVILCKYLQLYKLCE